METRMPLSPWIAVNMGFILVLLYVLPFYAFRSAQLALLSRDHPHVIAFRTICAFAATAVAIIIIRLFTSSWLETVDGLGIYKPDVPWITWLLALLQPVLFTLMLYSGPILLKLVLFLTQQPILHHSYENFYLKRMQRIRALVTAPVTEEIVLRAVE